MLETGSVLMRNFWYLAVPGEQLARGKTLAKQLMGEPVLLGRTSDGEVFAMRDICPHRGIPLRHGSFDGQQVACCYHGWKFAPDGRCTEIPSIAPGQDFSCDRIKAKTYPCREVQGNIWVYFAKGTADPDDLPEVPRMPDMGDRPPQVAISMDFPCDADQAAFGLMDPTHAAFVHTSWWWKKQASKLRPKEKHFEPSPLGWRMVRHKLPAEHRVYKMLGNNVTTEIAYALPGLRIEHIQGDKHSAVGLTAITPVNENETEVHQCLYWTIDWLAPLKPLARRLSRVFLGQDRDVVVKQQEGLAYNPTLMLIDDADTQAKWYYRLKREWLRAAEEKRPFENPIKAKTLRWRS
ncbi:aromatic ring-hydroxylating dioxygenase subunit alpha [Pelagibius sp. Alg239-R121]|uniref:aromatic ring-hydroxylating oxygenase subunit alpha n=1 Tax=Pelagibius sp. Alg239-R121 TaxID=2993448 RepID=UPI0024A7280A|nr:aromatic ring-hydroxylating dioxygenase subunit alpha [Pelagibius sp. Alg239-R121]